VILSGQLGSAQLGDAQLGQLASSLAQGAGFPIMLDSGPLAEPKKKKPKKVKQPKQKKVKRVKIVATPSVSVADPVPTPTVSESAPLFVSPDTVIASEPFNTAKYLEIQAEVHRQARLHETIAEEDELLLLIC
jgi:hypothetical protein